MKRISITFFTAITIGSMAFAAGPVAPRESVEPPGQATTNPPAHPGAATESASPATRSTGQAGQTGQTGKPLSAADQAFLQQAAERNQYDLELSKAAARISGSPEVRKAAKAMERDLTTARQQLESLAASKGITLPTSMSQPLRDKLTAMESRTSGQFDQEYITDQVKVKEETINFFERESSRATDPDVKAWAQQVIPNLKNHLSMLQTTQPSAVGEKTAPGASPARGR